MNIFFSMTCVIIFCSLIPDSGFISNQKKYERVRIAYAEKENLLKEQLLHHQLTFDNLNLLFIVYKAEQKLEVYVKSKTAASYNLLSSYAICASSGKLGPKCMQGDGQVPEGFYHINRFNPVSNYYLSLGINYPNLSDKKKSKATDPGGDIFIHGDCVTIGCIPMTNDKIKELYLLAIQAYQCGQQKIPVYIFPFKPTNENMKQYRHTYADNPELISFWEELKKGFDKFQSQKKQVTVVTDKEGKYVF